MFLLTLAGRGTTLSHSYEIKSQDSDLSKPTLGGREGCSIGRVAAPEGLLRQ
jgi:hypothetical protein